VVPDEADSELWSTLPHTVAPAGTPRPQRWSDGTTSTPRRFNDGSPLRRNADRGHVHEVSHGQGKGDAGEEGAYRTDAERELQRFQRWCLGETADPANASPPESWAGVVDGDTVRFADLDTTVFSDYARHLSTAGYAAGTVLTYYAHVASWCGWAHAQGYIPRHYARESDAEDPLPENDGRRRATNRRGSRSTAT